MQGQHSKQPPSSAQMGEALGKHRQAIAEHGITPYHRKTFRLL